MNHFETHCVSILFALHAGKLPYLKRMPPNESYSEKGEMGLIRKSYFQRFLSYRFDSNHMARIFCENTASTDAFYISLYPSIVSGQRARPIITHVVFFFCGAI